MKSIKSETIITGDFNIGLLKVNDRPKVGDYFDLFCTNGFYPKITLPTSFSRDSCTLTKYSANFQLNHNLHSWNTYE